MKRVVIVHRWEGNPKHGWYPWAKKQLEKAGYKVLIPKMPHTEAPVMHEWIAALMKTVGKPNTQTHFIGHSIGCQTILRYISMLPKKEKVGKVVFVAPWTKPKWIEKEAKSIAKPWIETPINWSAAKKNAQSYSAIFSNNDVYVSASKERALFKKNLKARTRLLKKKGHFTQFDGVRELPEALDALAGK